MVRVVTRREEEEDMVGGRGGRTVSPACFVVCPCAWSGLFSFLY